MNETVLINNNGMPWIPYLVPEAGTAPALPTDIAAEARPLALQLLRHIHGASLGLYRDKRLRCPVYVSAGDAASVLGCCRATATKALDDLTLLGLIRATALSRNGVRAYAVVAGVSAPRHPDLVRGYSARILERPDMTRGEDDVERMPMDLALKVVSGELTREQALSGTVAVVFETVEEV